MHQAALQPSKVWQRRTNKVIATAIIIIGLTMMISTIPQCIYAGLIFIVVSLVWLAYMRMLETKNAADEQLRIEQQQAASPVLFLVTAPDNQNRRVPTQADPNDIPPSYDQILKLDGLPPDYVSLFMEKPPRYEDLGIIQDGVQLQPVQTPNAARSDCIRFAECNITHQSGNETPCFVHKPISKNAPIQELPNYEAAKILQSQSSKISVGEPNTPPNVDRNNFVSIEISTEAGSVLERSNSKNEESLPQVDLTDADKERRANLGH